MDPEMNEALALTRAGRLTEATELLQRRLAGAGAGSAPPVAIGPRLAPRACSSCDGSRQPLR